MRSTGQRASGYHDFERLAELLVSIPQSYESELFSTHEASAHQIPGLEEIEEECVAYEITELDLMGLSKDYRIDKLHIFLGPEGTVPITEDTAGSLLLYGSARAGRDSLPQERFRIMVPYNDGSSVIPVTKYGLVTAQGPRFGREVVDRVDGFDSRFKLNRIGIRRLGGIMIEIANLVTGQNVQD